MNPVARKALEKLFRSAENAAAKDAPSSRAIQLQFSEASFPDYQRFGTRATKIECNSDLRLAHRSGAIEIDWDARAGEFEHIKTIRLVDGFALANFLGVTSRWDSVASASDAFARLIVSHPVLTQVLENWKRGVAVRSTKASNESVKDWIDAAQVVDVCAAPQNSKDDTPIRSLSSRLFGDSKRIEDLCALIDVLAQGQVGGLSRHEEEVFQQLGLVKFPQTMLVAATSGAAVSISLGKAVVDLAPPYLGVYPPAITNIQSSSDPITLLTIENLTSFHESLATLHSKAGQRILIIYTGGMPSPSWRRVYKLVMKNIPAASRVFHWGDVDAGGFRIADVLASDCNKCGKRLELHLMDVAPAVARKSLSDAEIRSIRSICEKRGWGRELAAIVKHGAAVEQESLEVSLPH